MKNTLISLVAFAVAVTAAPAAPIEERDTCLSDASIISNKYAAPGTRYTVAFSSSYGATLSGTARDDYMIDNGRNIWNDIHGNDNCADLGDNIQVYFDAGANSYVIDDTEALGPAGNSAVNCLTQNFQRQWASFACPNGRTG